MFIFFYNSLMVTSSVSKYLIQPQKKSHIYTHFSQCTHLKFNSSSGKVLQKILWLIMHWTHFCPIRLSRIRFLLPQYHLQPIIKQINEPFKRSTKMSGFNLKISLDKTESSPHQVILCGFATMLSLYFWSVSDLVHQVHNHIKMSPLQKSKLNPCKHDPRCSFFYLKGNLLLVSETSPKLLPNWSNYPVWFKDILCFVL